MFMWKDNSPIFPDSLGNNPGSIVTLPFTALVCYCQNGRVSAKLFVPGSLVYGSCGANGVLTYPPGCGGARP